jgi:cyclin-dependent kinase-like
MQNKYEVLGVVGEGAYGIVYKCKNKETGKYVAIKKFKEVGDELVKKTMKRELKMLQRLHHPNVVEFQDAFRRKGNLFLVFEFVDKNLLELLQEHPNGLDPNLIRHLIYQLCKSIKYLHEQNIIHRDIKPENLLITDKMESKLCDFGFARLVSETNEKLTDYVATRWYRAPELLLSQGNYGKEVDYWAIGCIMGELVDGNPLFPGENELDQIHCIQKVLGNLTDKQEEMFYNNPIFNGKSLLNVTKPETLEKRYMGKFSKKAISFMKGLLALDPKKRLNGNTVFKHAYFEKLVLADLQKEVEQRMQTQNEKNNSILMGQVKEEQRISMKSKTNSDLLNKGNLNNFKNEKNENTINIKSNNEISQIISTRLLKKNSNSKILVSNTSNPKLNETPGNEANNNLKIVSNNNIGNSNNINNIKNNISTNNYSNTISTLPQNPTNITNINIISYNNYEENHSQGSNNITLNSNNNNIIKKNIGGANSKKKYTNMTKKKDKSPNSVSMKKSINKMATSINFNQKNKSNQNFISFINPNVTNNNINSNNQINNSNNILDNAYKTFYKKNKEKDIYNIELDLANCNPSDSNDNMKNYFPKNKYDVIDEEEEFTKEEKIKLKQLASLYKNANIGYYKKNSPDKNIGNKNKYHAKISPNKNGYYYYSNKGGYSNKNSFHLPVIQKGGLYNYIYH